MHPLLVFILVVVTGFISAGFLSSLYQVFTKKSVSFNMADEKGIGMLFSILTLIFAGPFVLMRNSLMAFSANKRHGGWVAASTAISIFWSFVSGVFLMNVYITAMI
ncbi:MAG: hypothetical protein HRU28_06215 [Rhizobiales bacterium]|nr:hypothetical protein [Hyphomicrobiales bacterium]